MATAKGSGKGKSGAKSGGAGPATTPPKMVTEDMTASTRTLLTMLRSKIMVNKEDGRIALKAPRKLKEALTMVGGPEWATEVLAQAKEAVEDHNSFKTQGHAVFIVP